VTDDEDLQKVATAATAPGETIHNMPTEISVGELVSALKSIERFARRVRSDAQLPAPVAYAHAARVSSVAL
jgi:glycerol dehydrogenase